MFSLKFFISKKVLDIYKHSLEWKHSVCKLFLKKDVYPKYKRIEPGMKVFRPSKTLHWADNITCGYMPVYHFGGSRGTVLRLCLVLFCMATLLLLGCYSLENKLGMYRLVL